MCGVVGYIGNKYCRQYIIEGLGRLEYRGYDSAGFACIDNKTHSLTYQKAEGQLKNLIDKLNSFPIDGSIGIGHTRWATHGEISEQNAHPHFDCKKTLALVHNGIIENHHELRASLIKKGHVFHSLTDTEVLAHSCEEAFKDNDALSAIKSVVKNLEGAYAFVALFKDKPDQLIAVRKGSPLCIGIAHDQTFVASDPLAFAGFAQHVIFLPDQSFALVGKNNIELYDFNGTLLNPEIVPFDMQWSDDGKNGYKHFMLKEIYEQKNGIQSTLSLLRSLDADAIFRQLGVSKLSLQELRSITIVAAGTSWHAGRIAQFFFESLCKIPARVMLASEFRYMPYFKEEKNLTICISQSGETLDTLECLRLVKEQGNFVLAITNVASSTMVREASGYILTKAGREIAVASTKAFSTQLIALYWFAHYIALEKALIDQAGMEKMYDDAAIATEVLENSLEKYRQKIVKEYAPFYAQFKRFIFLGRHISYPFALEAALKLKEISYIFSQCYPAGELKHGPIALLDAETPVILFSHLDPYIYQKVLSNAQEVKARKAHLVAFVFEGQDQLQELADCSFIIPKVNPLLAPLAMTGLMQFFVYEIAHVLGCPIDKPRNLAKSVTVE
ncbi:MAG: glutamine--fructose-6-phosphate transaminase (isomerizing) [Candidatus Babeliales bacterium]